ncbi:DNA-directed RNA polymerase subunit H [Methanocella sp. CWC-04]|uniref:DNA-directed RNA polymerase subunit Rpo5 n=1 Tax=Methanooceanicella nereidis TaxID=2052831 RepID=A0AAP2RAN5_9EURY|nr:DNA-directed RNA polymerase subunit H [Methanocella sp. CWC-04]MCD1294004.1 DNA-directed RNA polymerase subunit H [Methanocella sp. CWC-04]
MTKKFDVLKHVLVPHHELLPEDEVITLLEAYRIEKGQLPKIKTSDVVAKQLEAKAGDVIKITRNSLTAGRAVAYRLVID